MASLDHQAIRRAYPDVTVIQDSKGAFKADGTEVTLVQSAIDAARVELDKTKYKLKGDEHIKGFWSAPFDWPVTSIHSVLLPNEKVLIPKRD